MDTIWLEMILIGVAILANGFFAGSEFALVSARQARLTRLRDQSVRGAATALSLKRDPETFLATIQIVITLVGTLASAVGGATAIEALTPWLAGLPLPGARQWAEPVALAIVILTITYVSLVLGELVPKALALRNPERVACRSPGRSRPSSGPRRGPVAFSRSPRARSSRCSSRARLRPLRSCRRTRSSTSSGKAVAWGLRAPRERARAPCLSVHGHPGARGSWCRVPESWPWTSTPLRRGPDPRGRP